MVAETVGQEPKTAFLRLFAQYGQALYRLAGAYTDSPADREDLVQEIAAALWQALPRYRAEASERTWLYRIAHNVAFTAALKLRKRQHREVAPLEGLERPSRDSAERQLLEEEKRRMLLEAIRDLPPFDRQITVLHLEGLSGAEIEEVTGLSEGAVATRLTRIREKLRKTIRAKEVGDGR